MLAPLIIIYDNNLCNLLLYWLQHCTFFFLYKLIPPNFSLKWTELSMKLYFRDSLFLQLLSKLSPRPRRYWHFFPCFFFFLLRNIFRVFLWNHKALNLDFLFKKEAKPRLSENQTTLRDLTSRKMPNIMKLVIKIARAGSMTIAGDEYVCQGFPDIVINRLRCLNAAYNKFRNEGNFLALCFVLYWTSCCTSENTQGSQQKATEDKW